MKSRFPVHHRLAIAAVLGATLLGACASKGDAPTAQLVTARAAITQAESAGALRTAPVELLAAREKLGRAEAASREERFAEARQLAEHAEADAALAERKSRAARAQVAADELARGNDLLRKETDRRVR